MAHGDQTITEYQVIWSNRLGIHMTAWFLTKEAADKYIEWIDADTRLRLISGPTLVQRVLAYI